MIQKRPHPFKSYPNFLVYQWTVRTLSCARLVPNYKKIIGTIWHSPCHDSAWVVKLGVRVFFQLKCYDLKGLNKYLWNDKQAIKRPVLLEENSKFYRKCSSKKNQELIVVFHEVRLKKFHLKSGFANWELFEHLKSKSVMEFLPSQDGEALLRN